jgi:hypothetical protein
MTKCAGITQAGTACKGIPIDDSQYCYVHHPETVGERRRHGSKGGKRGGRGRPLGEISSVKAQLQDLADGVLDGSVERADASVVSQVLNTLIRAISTEIQVKEQVDHEQRLQNVETLLDNEEEYGHGA